MIFVEMTRGFTALLDDEDKHLSERRWCVSVMSPTLAYAQRSVVLDDGRTASALLHREVMGLTQGDGKIVDHLNGNGLDCRKENLRVVSQQENKRNLAGPRRDGTSGFLGVNREKTRWRAQIKIGDSQKTIGIFSTPEEANVARLNFEKDVWGIQPRRRAAFEAAGLA